MYVKPVANVSKAVSRAVLSALLIGTLLSACAGSSALDGGPEGDVNNESDSLVSESGQGSSERNVVTELELQHRSGQTFLPGASPDQVVDTMFIGRLSRLAPPILARRHY